MAPALAQDPLYGLAFEQGEWVGSLQPGSTAHRELDRLASLVEAKLNAREPSPWPAVPGSLAPGAAQAAAPGELVYIETWHMRPELQRRPGWLRRVLEASRRLAASPAAAR